MTVVVTLKEAQERLAELATLAEKGETVMITVDGKPVAELVAPPGPKKGGIDFEAGERFLREHGIDRFFGEVPADFDDPLPEDFLITPLPK